MKRSLLFLSLLMGAFPAVAWGKYVYRQPNNAANFVKLDNVKEKEVQALGMTMPYTFTEEKMIDILRTLRYSRKSLFSDKEKIRSVYEMEYIDRFSPYLVKAFAEAKPNEVVIWSVAQKRPLVILRNDRLTQVRMWVANNNELHIDFMKTEAYLQGDYQARTPEGGRLIEQSKGLRIMLDPQEGQKFGLTSMEELVLDLNSDFVRIADAIVAEDLRLEAEEKTKKNKKRTQREAKAEPATAPSPVPPVSTPTTPSVKDQKDAEARLEELKRLQEKGLISKEDYNKKKEEILQGL